MPRRIDTSIAKNFIEAQESLGLIIERYGLKKDYVCQKANMNRKTFYNKLKNKSFTGEEFMRISEAINN